MFHFVSFCFVLFRFVWFCFVSYREGTNQRQWKIAKVNETERLPFEISEINSNRPPANKSFRDSRIENASWCIVYAHAMFAVALENRSIKHVQKCVIFTFSMMHKILCTKLFLSPFPFYTIPQLLCQKVFKWAFYLIQKLNYVQNYTISIRLNWLNFVPRNCRWFFQPIRPVIDAWRGACTSNVTNNVFNLHEIRCKHIATVACNRLELPIAIASARMRKERMRLTSSHRDSFSFGSLLFQLGRILIKII